MMQKHLSLNLEWRFCHVTVLMKLPVWSSKWPKLFKSPVAKDSKSILNFLSKSKIVFRCHLFIVTRHQKVSPNCHRLGNAQTNNKHLSSSIVSILSISTPLWVIFMSHTLVSLPFSSLPKGQEVTNLQKMHMNFIHHLILISSIYDHTNRPYDRITLDL